MKTAMQEAIGYLREFNLEASAIILEDKFLKKEKEQIIDAFVECWKENMPDGHECKLSAKEYYNKTYQKKDKTFKQKSKWV